MSFEVVRAHEGYWRFVDPPAGLGDVTEGFSANYLSEGDEQVLKGALAVSEAADRYFANRPDRLAVTFLSHLISLPKPEDLENPQAHRISLRKALGAIGFQLMRHGGNANSLERKHPRKVVPGELENASLTFGRVIALHGTGARPQASVPQGVGYATALRSSQPGSFTLGWCDPTNGRRNEGLVDVVRIRQEFPGLRPEMDLPLPGSPDH